jgi:hypothetical protein
MRRLVLPAVVAALATSAVGVAVNLATDWRTNVVAWVVVVVLTLLSAGVTIWLIRRQEPSASGWPVVRDATIGRDNIQLGRVGRDVTIERDV